MVTLVFVYPLQEQSVTQWQDVTYCDSDNDYHLQYTGEIWKPMFQSENMFSFHTTLEKFENVSTSFILDLPLKKIRKGKSYYNWDVNVFEKLHFKKIFCPR